MGLALRNSYATELEGMYLPFEGDDVPDPQIFLLNNNLADELNLSSEDQGLATMLAGIAPPPGSMPLAMAYAGHQFGGFSPSLGDGRAMLLVEVVDRDGHLRDIHLKGSGRTPFSRGADGKAALAPVLREYLMGEAMFALGIPTTRALAVVTTGERILREEGMLPGAVLARVAASHLRVGTFQFFAARGEHDKLARLLAYAVARHDPDLADMPRPPLAFLERVARRQAALIAQWMGVGFVHGVMNTDNMTISGETIDYGPCAFMDAHDPATVFSSIDRQGRYAYGNQPAIVQWNIARLAEALLPLIDADEDRAIAAAMAVLEQVPEWYEAAWGGILAQKMGLDQPDAGLSQRLLKAMTAAAADHTMTFRALSRAVAGDPVPLRAILPDSDAWANEWLAAVQLSGRDPAQIAASMDAVNPVYIPRNHLVEEALTAATSGDLGPFKAFLTVLEHPFDARSESERYALPAPSGFGHYRTYCGT